MVSAQLQVAVDVGSQRHRVAVADVTGGLLEEFDVKHTAAGLAGFFTRIEHWEARCGWPVAVAMMNIHSRPRSREPLSTNFATTAWWPPTDGKAGTAEVRPNC